ncbi:MAG: hypothetical protein H8E70_02320 [Candidatus Marinimicrobia bacterium]|nr:hypothetical protein [Candidatus Neomarinimicrobiota bacterium]
MKQRKKKLEHASHESPTIGKIIDKQESKLKLIKSMISLKSNKPKDGKSLSIENNSKQIKK